MAFFPCIYFEALQHTYYDLGSINLRCLSKREKYETVIERIFRREYFYKMLFKLYGLCDILGLRLIIENPATAPHYLIGTQNFPKPTMIDKNRLLRGDYYKKPTAYWFVNMEPTSGESFKLNRNAKKIQDAKKGVKAGICSEERSMISPTYARNFICDFILGVKNENSCKTLFDEL